MGSIDKRDNTPQLLNRLRMRQVALILAIDERQTLRAAAAELGLTQPAATKMLQELEDALGQPLFERVGRRLQRNAAGERVLE
ncbi:MAG: helix-turn-helix domain-containing protein, partial [Comamonas testosteroni]